MRKVGAFNYERLERNVIASTDTYCLSIGGSSLAIWSIYRCREDGSKPGNNNKRMVDHMNVFSTSTS